MREYEARQLAQQRANETGETVYVVTHRDHPGADYDIALAGSLHRATEVVDSFAPNSGAE